LVLIRAGTTGQQDTDGEQQNFELHVLASSSSACLILGL